MPYVVVEEPCTNESGEQGSAMIYVIEDDKRVPFACHQDPETAYSIVAMLEEAEGLKENNMEELENMMEDEMVEEKQFEEGQLVHWVSEEEEGFGRVESTFEDTYSVRVYAQAGDDFEPTDRVLELPFAQVHDYMEYMTQDFDKQIEEVMQEIDLPEEEEEESDIEIEISKEMKEVNLQPTKEMADEAELGLKWRDEYGRGGTEVGVARARDIMNRKNLSEETVNRMVSYFSRHEVDLKSPANSDPSADGYPGAGLIAWKLWGGNPGKGWAERKQAELDAQKKAMDYMQEDLEEETKADPDNLSVGDFVRWESGDGTAQGKIEQKKTEGTLNVPDSDFELNASEEDPAFLIEVYERVEGGWRPSGVMVGHKAGVLSKIEPLEIAELKRRILAKFKSLEAKVEEAEDMKIGVIEGMASTYGNTDLGGDVVEKGAFKQTLNHSKVVPLLLDHNYTTAGVAGVAELEDTEKGLMLKAEMPLDVPEVAAAYRKIKFMIDKGSRMGLSIGYDPVKTEPGEDGTRKLKEIALHEVSVTPFPMNTEAQIMSAKANRMKSKSKQYLWQTLKKEMMPDEEMAEMEMEKENDTPNGNQKQQDAMKALVEQIEKVFKEAIEDIKQELNLETTNDE